jgi:hypothetical protein
VPSHSIDCTKAKKVSPLKKDSQTFYSLKRKAGIKGNELNLGFLFVLFSLGTRFTFSYLEF